MRGGTAVFKCDIKPEYVNEYVKVVGWTKGTDRIHAGTYILFLSSGEQKSIYYSVNSHIIYSSKKVTHNTLVYRQVQIIVVVTCVLYISNVKEYKE